jgi:hypothetical protein
MPIDASEWETATPAEDVYTSVYQVLAGTPTTAYCVDDFFRDAAPSAPEAFELLARLLDAIEQRASRERSTIVIEQALETLTYEGHLRKRTVDTGEGTVAYYRIAETPDEAE